MFYKISHYEKRLGQINDSSKYFRNVVNYVLDKLLSTLQPRKLHRLPTTASIRPQLQPVIQLLYISIRYLQKMKLTQYPRNTVLIQQVYCFDDDGSKELIKQLNPRPVNQQEINYFKWENKQDHGKNVRQINLFRPSFGCEHFTQKFSVRCLVCNKAFPCVYCHNQSEDHEFQLKYQICNACGYRQNFYIFCSFCGEQFGQHSCAQCSIIYNQAGEFTHCGKCQKCYLTQNKHFHDASCGNQQVDQICPVCLEILEQNKFIMNSKCQHFCHFVCAKLIDNYQCPICKKSNIQDCEKEQFLQQLVASNQSLVTPKMFCKFRCNDCNSIGISIDGKFIMCQKCRFFNCERLERATHQQYKQYRKEFTNFIEISTPLTFEEAVLLIQDPADAAKILIKSYKCKTKTEVGDLFGEINEALNKQQIEITDGANPKI